MQIEQKREQLNGLYAKFEEIARPYLDAAVCEEGCADCCIQVGNVDITTLEGIIIRQHLLDLAPDTRKRLNKKLKQNRKRKKVSKYARCAFLLDDNRCAIYAVRPFSCRRLYSIRRCGNEGPMVHRQAWEAAEVIASAIREVDENGYTGHMSYILHLLNDAGFRKIYLAGEFAPQSIREFGLKYGITINRSSFADYSCLGRFDV